MFLECARLQPLDLLHQHLLLRSWLCFSLHSLILSRPIHSPTTARDLLVNLLLALAKLALYVTMKVALAGKVPGDRRAIFLGFLRSHLWAEHHWAGAVSNLAAFESLWALSVVLCLVSLEGALVLTL